MMKGKFKDILTKKKNRGDITLKMESSTDGSTNSEDEEMALITRRFKKMFKKGGKTNKKNMRKMFKPKPEAQIKKETPKIICFKCNKLGHLRANSPKLKNKIKKDKFKKAMVAT